MNKILIAMGVLLIFLVAGIGVSGWWYAQDVKRSYNTESREMVTHLANLDIKMQRVFSLYQQQDGTPRNTEEKVRVLGAMTAVEPSRESLQRQVGEVLGLEDTPSMKLSRDIDEGLNQSLEALKKVRDGNQKVKNLNAIPELNFLISAEPPVDATGTMSTKLSSTRFFKQSN